MNNRIKNIFFAFQLSSLLLLSACHPHHVSMTSSMPSTLLAMRHSHLRYLMKVGAVVWKIGDCVHITLPADVLFVGRDDRIRNDAKPFLQEAAAYLNTFHLSQIKVVGFVDNPLGADRAEDYCLSRRRAQSIVEMVGVSQVDARLIFAEGAGHCRPLGNDGTVMGREMNRRIELIATVIDDRLHGMESQ